MKKILPLLLLAVIVGGALASRFLPDMNFGSVLGKYAESEGAPSVQNTPGPEEIVTSTVSETEESEAAVIAEGKEEKDPFAWGIPAGMIFSLLVGAGYAFHLFGVGRIEEEVYVLKEVYLGEVEFPSVQTYAQIRRGLSLRDLIERLGGIHAFWWSKERKVERKQEIERMRRNFVEAWIRVQVPEGTPFTRVPSILQKSCENFPRNSEITSSGWVLVSLSLGPVNLSPQLEGIAATRERAQADAHATELTAQANANAERAMGSARADNQRLMAEAEAYGLEQVAAAQKQAAMDSGEAVVILMQQIGAKFPELTPKELADTIAKLRLAEGGATPMVQV